MRDLTLQEKVTIKGMIHKRLGISLPNLKMDRAVRIFPRIFGCSVGEWWKVGSVHRTTYWTLHNRKKTR